MRNLNTLRLSQSTVQGTFSQSLLNERRGFQQLRGAALQLNLWKWASDVFALRAAHTSGGGGGAVLRRSAAPCPQPTPRPGTGCGQERVYYQPGHPPSQCTSACEALASPQDHQGERSGNLASASRPPACAPPGKGSNQHAGHQRADPTRSAAPWSAQQTR